MLAIEKRFESANKGADLALKRVSLQLVDHLVADLTCMVLVLPVILLLREHLAVITLIFRVETALGNILLSRTTHSLALVKIWRTYPSVILIHHLLLFLDQLAMP